MDINASQNNPQDDGNLIDLKDILSTDPNEKSIQNKNINIPNYSMSKQDTFPLSEDTDSAPLTKDASSLYNINEIDSYPIQIPKRELEEKNDSISNNNKDFTISTTINRKQTLNESIIDTLLNDVCLIYNKLKYVINPFSSDDNKRIHIRQWDLWGPLIFVTILS